MAAGSQGDASGRSRRQRRPAAVPRRCLDYEPVVQDSLASLAPALRSASSGMTETVSRVATAGRRRHVFVSYASADRTWADWIGWQLVDDGWLVETRAWDSSPGANFLAWIDGCLARADYVLLVVSEAYLATSPWGAAQWHAAYLPGQRRVLPVRIADVDAGELVRVLGWIDLFDVHEATARRRLLDGVRPAPLESSVPTGRPAFPTPDGGAPRRT